MKREEILNTAIKCVCGRREQDYGNPEDNFKQIAKLWTVYTGYTFSPVDVAMMMALLKIARISGGGGTGDSFVDLAEYAACGGEIATRNDAPADQLTCPNCGSKVEGDTCTVCKLKIYDGRG